MHGEFGVEFVVGEQFYVMLRTVGQFLNPVAR